MIRFALEVEARDCRGVKDEGEKRKSMGISTAQFIQGGVQGQASHCLVIDACTGHIATPIALCSQVFPNQQFVGVVDVDPLVRQSRNGVPQAE